MKIQSIQKPKLSDHRLLRKVCLKLASFSIVTAAIVAIIIALLWVFLFNKILAFGSSLNFSELSFFGEQASEMAQSLNPYLWWLLCIVLTFIVIRIVIAVTRAIMNRSRYKLVDNNSFDIMCNQLSNPALDVLLWAWDDTTEPLRLGDLQVARKSLAGNKAERMYRAETQMERLQAARQGNTN